VLKASLKLTPSSGQTTTPMIFLNTPLKGFWSGLYFTFSDILS